MLWEITQGTLGKAPVAVTEAPGAEPQATTSAELEEEDADELKEMQNRLESLRS